MTNLQGKTILITAGPTYEKIDPVRFIGNFSTGKMGYAIAEQCAECGAKVILVSGPTNLSIKHADINRINVMSGEEMYQTCSKYHSSSDITIFCAAVADYTPKNPSDSKVKRQADELVIELVKNKDIAAELGKQKKNNQIHIGFALETDNEVVNAQGKLSKKNLDYIILNSLQDENAGFGYDTNKVTIISIDSITPLPLMSKKEVAIEITNLLK